MTWLRIAVATLLSVVTSMVAASDYTPTGFYYPLRTEEFHLCGKGRWLERSSDYGGNYFPNYYHIGVDISLGAGIPAAGKPVYAIADGQVTFWSLNGWSLDGSSEPADGSDLKNVGVFIKHKLADGRTVVAIYGHVKKSGIKNAVGAEVHAGDQIGVIGHWDFGDHLHFGVLNPGRDMPATSSGFGKLPENLYGHRFPDPAKSPFDNGFTDPIWFITHNAPDNDLSRAEYNYCPGEVNGPVDPWFSVMCGEADSLNPPTPCSGIAIALYQRCLDGKDVCGPEFGDYSSAIGGQGFGSGGAEGGVVGTSPLDLEHTPTVVSSVDETPLAPDANTLLVGMRVKVLAELSPKGGNVADWMEAGKDTTETDYYVQLNGGAWQKYDRQYTQAVDLPEGSHKTETSVSFTIPPGTTSISFRTRIDATDEVIESPEGETDNTRTRGPFFVADQLNIDLVVSYAGLTRSRTTLRLNEPIGVEMALRNIGTDNLLNGFRSRYEVMGPGTGNLWRELATDGSDASQLTPNRDQPELMLTEVAGFSIPGTYTVRVTADCLIQVLETNEGNNSFSFKFVIPDTRPDLTISYARLSRGRTFLVVNQTIGMEMAVRNIGIDTSTSGIRSGYFAHGPGTNYTWRELASDGSDAGELTANRNQPEAMLTDVSGFTIPGWYTGMVCADYLGQVPETNEGNNCYQFSFEVRPYLPDFIVADLYLKVGSTVIRNGGTVKRNSYVHPYCVAANIGTSGIHPANRLGYFVNQGVFRDSDGLDPNELCIGCLKTEYVSTDSIRLGDTGARTYRCCVDYQGVATELNEGNNCAIIGFTVVP